MLRFSLLAAALAAVMAAPASATIYATQIDWDGGVSADGIKDPTVRNDPDDALGAPDQAGDGNLNFLSLGLGGTAVFSFGEQFANSASVFEVTFGCGGGAVCSSHPEQVRVSAGNGYVDGSFDISSFTDYGLVTNGSAQGGGSVIIGGPFQYLALVDESAALGPVSTDGFDVDAAGVHPVSEPGSLALMGLGVGLLGLGTIRRVHRNRKHA